MLIGDEFPQMHDLDLRRPELREILTLVGKVTAELREHPLRVLGGQARWREATPKRSGYVELDVVVTNVGVQGFQLSNPLSAESNEGPLSVDFLDSQGSCVATVNLGPAHIHAAPGVSREPKVSLLPGSSLSFTVRTKVPVGPGRYEGQLVLLSHGREDDSETLQGRLRLDAGPLSVP
jgi:hypothetical protein